MFHILGAGSQFSALSHWSIFLTLYPHPTALTLTKFWYFNIWYGLSATLSFFKSFLAILGPLPFHMKCRMCVRFQVNINENCGGKVPPRAPHCLQNLHVDSTVWHQSLLRSSLNPLLRPCLPHLPTQALEFRANWNTCYFQASPPCGSWGGAGTPPGTPTSSACRVPYSPSTFPSRPAPMPPHPWSPWRPMTSWRPMPFNVQMLWGFSRPSFWRSCIYSSLSQSSCLLRWGNCA